MEILVGWTGWTSWWYGDADGMDRMDYPGEMERMEIVVGWIILMGWKERIILTPAEQAKARLQLVLEAAAKADEALKAKERSEEEAKRRKEEDQATLLDQVRRVKEIEAIESDAFIPQTFRSSKEVKKSTEPPELQHEPGNVGAGATEAAAPDKDPPAANIPTAIKYQDDNSLAHPNLFMEKAEAEERWFQRLVALRQERLMGSPVA
ncbi:PREDICTED: serine/Arginine-related protein 53-like [Sturnus vulgaris]|uniref:serine/Arginine-related protein 53-like n=1 Tax=Sturnus vulgaris TaxID=9172 RepID=UPI00071A9E3F|nr:PREDICTED: serine/Arginine-related protein 53-like [Sturnus vulgaris]